MQLATQDGTDSVRDLGLLCPNKMLQRAGVLVVNAAMCALCQSFQLLLDKIGRGFPRTGIGPLAWCFADA